MASWLPHLHALEQLSLADNHLAALPPAALPRLPALSKLWLYGNRLRRLPPDLASPPHPRSCVRARARAASSLAHSCCTTA